jgi:Aminoglycoside/hydroxyurea antibiotic resistance kinase
VRSASTASGQHGTRVWCAKASRGLRELPLTAQKLVLLHQDFHPRNILSAQREPWLAIDPKPVVGDPAFDPVQVIVQVGDLLARDDPVGEVTRRLKTLSDLLSVDGQRILLWALARCVEWALLSLERSDSDSSERCMAWARAIARADTSSPDGSWPARTPATHGDASSGIGDLTGCVPVQPSDELPTRLPDLPMSEWQGTGVSSALTFSLSR